MTEAQVGYLYNIATAVSRVEHNETLTLLKSYYLMRCKDITRGYGLPDKYFSSKIRCPNCCIEWKNSTEIKVRSLKLSKRLRQRLKSSKVKENKKALVRRKTNLLHSNEIEQICIFCKQSTVTPSLKPHRQSINHQNIEENDNTKETETENSKSNNVQKSKSKNIKHAKKKNEINVYSNALDVFSLQNKNNSFPLKEKKPKAISNNKKKKDKFAGLCKKAVLASAKLKGKHEKQNKLKLFLKPSL